MPSLWVSATANLVRSNNDVSVIQAEALTRIGHTAGVLHKSVPVAAVVVEFTGGIGSWVARTYTATRGGGAFLNGTRISVSNTEALQRALVVSRTIM